MTHPLPRKSFLLILAILLCALLVGCTSASPTAAQPLPADQAETAVDPTDTAMPPSPSPTVKVFRTLTPYPTRTPIPTRTRTATPTVTATPTITPTPTVTAQGMTISGYPLSVSTGVPASGEPIGAENITRLAGVAQWGKGPIEQVLYTPDGASLLAIGPFGVAVYSAESFEQAPRWLPFDAPLYFEKVQVSQDGRYLRFQWREGEYQRANKYFSLETQEFIENEPAQDWVVLQKDAIGGYDPIGILSPDGKVRFGAWAYYPEDEYNLEQFSGVFYDAASEDALYGLQEESFYVLYEDYNSPEGCDLHSFSMCGNVYTPNIMSAYRGSFSYSGNTLAILFRPHNLFRDENFSILRLYDASNGSRVASIGSFDQPVMDFAFQPNADRIAVALVNGSIQVWDGAGQKLLRQAWHFNPPTSAFDFSTDGRFLIVQHRDTVEVRRTSDGALLSRYEASAAALSPVENLLALGNKQGEVQVEGLDRQQTISRMEGHTRVIYALTFSPDGQTLTSSSEDCSIRSWDVRTGQFQHFYEEASVDAIGEGWTESRIFVYYMQYLPGSDRLMGFGSWGTAASWNTQSGAKDYAVVSQPLEYWNGMQTLNPHFPASFWVVPEEQRFYIDETGYDVNTGEPVGGYTASPGQPSECSVYGPVSKDGSLRFTAGYGDLTGQVCVLNAADNSLLYRLPVYPKEHNTVAPISRVFLSPDGTRLFAASSAGPVFVYQVGE